MKVLYKPFTVLLAGVMSLLVLTSCGASSSDPSDGGLQTPGLQSDRTPEEFIPADTGVVPRSGFNLPYLGLSVTLPQALQDAMADKTIYMGADESPAADGASVEYALLSWSALTESQKTETIAYDGEAFAAWRKALPAVAVLGVYDEASSQQLDTLTGLTDHQLLGEYDGYHYYLSTDPASDRAALTADLGVKLYPPTPLIPGDSAFAVRKEAITNLGSFTMQDIDGETYTEALFAEHELTMVNLFATWCSPCIREIPELEQLHHDLADQGFGLIGVVLDGADPTGTPDPKAIEKAKELAEKTGASYPFLLPDSSAMNGRLIGVDSVPESFFVDREGNIVGEVYLGARSLEDWTAVVQQELQNLKEAE